ncbi:MAG TPA: hypothetical protein VJW55_19275 [Candidatus Angelobacter sp.]|nr:hypothetical protein [Candidatus Angelobacter sp.]
MKNQHRIAKILSTTLTAGIFLSQSLFAQQSSNQQPTQQSTETTQQQAQPATQPATAQPAQNQNATPAATAAQSQEQTQQNQSAQPQQQNQQQQPVNPSGTTVNPSQAPLQPVTTYPDASGAQQEQQPSTTTTPEQSNIPENPQPKKQPSEPVGAAAAESVPTAGGAAAKPAGVAIAPAKQHQTRSLLIKVGAALAAGAAIGTVFALSHSSPSTPPGSGLPGVTQK